MIMVGSIVELHEFARPLFTKRKTKHESELNFAEMLEAEQEKLRQKSANVMNILGGSE